jgi:uncharacterized membrane protein
MSLSAFVPVLLLGVVLVGILVLFLFLPRNTFHTGAGSSADPALTGPIFRDDDRYWILGSIYYNPDDPLVLVPNRNGRGWTPNMGHPLGKLLMIGLVLVLLLLALLRALAH